jgi:hypothetical protein
MDEIVAVAAQFQVRADDDTNVERATAEIIAKFVRAIKNGEEVAKLFEQADLDGAADFLPVKGELK